MKRTRYVSKRQLELLLLVANGNTNAQIARKLGISEPTVAECLSRAYVSLRVHDRTQAVVVALHLRLFNLEDLQLPTGIPTHIPEESVKTPVEKVPEIPSKTTERDPREVRWAFRMADILSHLDRCQHGRHEGDLCDPCGYVSLGNPHVRTGQPLGYDLRGNRISLPPRGEKENPAAWRG